MNRLRLWRQSIRLPYRAQAATLSPGHAYLVHAGPGAAGRSYAELEAALAGALCALREDTR